MLCANFSGVHVTIKIVKNQTVNMECWQEKEENWCCGYVIISVSLILSSQVLLIETYSWKGCHIPSGSLSSDAFLRVYISIWEIKDKPNECKKVNKEAKLWKLFFHSHWKNKGALLEQLYFPQHKHFIFNKYLWKLAGRREGYILLIKKGTKWFNK